MFHPALAIFWMAASCRLPLGRPNFNFLSLIFPNHAPALHCDAAFSQSADHFGIEPPFTFLNALVQRRRRVFRQNRDRFLSDDWPAINTLIDEMNGAAGDLHAVIERLLPGFQARKR